MAKEQEYREEHGIEVAGERKKKSYGATKPAKKNDISEDVDEF